jgi:hypothetical protein
MQRAVQAESSAAVQAAKEAAMEPAKEAAGVEAAHQRHPPSSMVSQLVNAESTELEMPAEWMCTCDEGRKNTTDAMI